ncbi:MAG: hypothetical protein AAGH64_06200, partial [Planctomycetota bacterium]
WTSYEKGNYRPEERVGKHISGDQPPVDTDSGRGMRPGAPGNMMTSIRGLYAFGEANFAFHGATRLGANALLSCIFDGLFNGLSVANYVTQLHTSGAHDGSHAESPASAIHQSVFDDAVRREQEKYDALLARVTDDEQQDDLHNPYVIAKELGEEMTAACTVVKTGERLEKAIAKIQELKDRYSNVQLADGAMWTNQSLAFARAVGDMLRLADLTLLASKMREESRGSHYRLDFPERNDERFLKTSYGVYDAESDSPRVEWRDVDTSLVEPRARTYGKVDKTDDHEETKDKKRSIAGVS